MSENHSSNGALIKHRPLAARKTAAINSVADYARFDWTKDAFRSENALFRAYFRPDAAQRLRCNFPLHVMQTMNAERPAVPLDRSRVEVSKICRKLKLLPANIAVFLWSTRS
jgi:hypothetical protein